MVHPRYVLQEELAIRKLITFYYREMPKSFYTSGEKHDFWEFVYIDKGELEVFTDAGTYSLGQGEMMFYKPNLFHGGRAINGTAPNMIIISFDCTSPCMRFFEDKRFLLQEEEHRLLSQIVQEGLAAFDPPIDSPYMKGCPTRREEALLGAEQLIRNYLEVLLIKLLRRGSHDKGLANRPPSISAEIEDDAMISAIIRYLQSNLERNFTLDELCEYFAMSQTRLKTLFRAKTGSGVITYFSLLKIQQAKRIIREESATIPEISEKLGYSSAHYFSKQFKRVTGMSPSEYARSISARTDNRRLTVKQ